MMAEGLRNHSPEVRFGQPVIRLAERFQRSVSPRMLLAAGGAALAVAVGIHTIESIGPISQPVPIVRSIEDPNLGLNQQSGPEASDTRDLWSKLATREHAAYGML